MTKEVTETKYNTQGRSSDIVRALNDYVNKTIMIKLKNNKKIQGTLKAYDEHMNLILTDTQDITENEVKDLNEILLRGANIMLVSLPKIDK